MSSIFFESFWKCQNCYAMFLVARLLQPVQTICAIDITDSLFIFSRSD